MEPRHERELAERGWTVLPSFAGRELTVAGREMLDRLLGPEPTKAVDDSRRQAGPWPKYPVGPSDAPVVTTGSWRHSVMHPINDPLPARLLAELPFVPLFQRLLRCDDPRRLHLLQHMFVRTDADPELVDGEAAAAYPPQGWHTDQTFLDAHYSGGAGGERAVYFHTMLALGDVRPRGAAFWVADGLYAKAKARVAAFSDAERDEMLLLYKSNQRPESLSFEALGGDEASKTEVTMREGDLLVIDPMITHSASPVADALPARHVVFTTIFASAAIGETLFGTTRRNSTAPPAKFPPALTASPALADRGHLFGWRLPGHPADIATPAPAPAAGGQKGMLKRVAGHLAPQPQRSAASAATAAAMPRRTLGRTGLSVSLLSLGTGGARQFGSVAGLGAEAQRALVTRALQLGVNLFDTSPGYGTEAMLGAALEGVPRSDYILCTKWDPKPFFPGGAASEEEEADVDAVTALTRSVEESCRALNTDYIDVCFFHGVPPEHYDECVDKMYDAMEAQRAAGRVRFIGLSTQFSASPGQEVAQIALERHPEKWDVLMLKYGILNQHAAQTILPLAARHDVGVLNMAAAREKLPDPTLLEETIARWGAEGQLPEALPAENPLGWLLSPDASTVVSAGYKFGAEPPEVSSVLTGTATMAHLEENAEALVGPPLPAAHSSRLRHLFGDIVEYA